MALGMQPATMVHQPGLCPHTLTNTNVVSCGLLVPNQRYVIAVKQGSVSSLAVTVYWAKSMCNPNALHVYRNRVTAHQCFNNPIHIKKALRL